MCPANTSVPADPAATSSSADRVKRAFPKLPPSGLLSVGALVLVILAFGLYYYIVAENRAGYLTARDLRQLNVIRNKTEAILTGFAGATNNWIGRMHDSSSLRVFFDRIDGSPVSGQAVTGETPVHSSRLKNIHLAGVDNELWLTYWDTVRSGKRKNFEELGKRIRIPLPGDPEALKELFDVVVLTDSSGQALYVNDISGLSLSITSIDSLRGAGGAPYSLDLATHATGVSSLDIAGMKFKVFTQPLTIPTSLHADNAPWLILGLVRGDKFRSQCLELPYDSVILFVFLISVAALSWPLVKVGFMGVSEALRPVEVLLIVLAALLGSSLVTAIVADYFCIQSSLTAELDHDLQLFAHSIEAHFHQELDSSLTQLRMFTTVANADTAKGDTLVSGLLIPAGTRAGLAVYPSVTTMYQIDSAGAQVLKWSVQKKTTPLISLKDRKYFQDAIQGRLWQTRIDSATVVSFAIEPHLSLTTGEFETSIVIPASIRGGRTGMAGLNTGPSSLYQPTVMHDFGFCIIDAKGAVQYHSDESRNLSEDLFEECDRDADLLTAVSTRTSCLARVTYWGERCTMYVEPIHDVPWFIVVFRQPASEKAANMEIMTITMEFFFLYSILLLGLFGIVAFNRSQHTAWIWPIDAHGEQYLRLMFFYLFASLVFLALRTFDMSADHLMVVTLALPAGAIVVTFLALRDPRHGSGVPVPGRTVTWPLIGLLVAALLCLTFIDPGAWFPWLICALSLAAGLLFIRSSRVMGFLRQEWRRCLIIWVILYIAATLLPMKFVQSWEIGVSLAGLVLGFIIVLVSWRASVRWKCSPWLNFRILYALCATAFLWFAAVQPTLNFFKIACDIQLELLVKHNQLHLATAREERSQRVRAKYANIATPAGFVEQRCRDTMDIYSGFFFNTGPAGDPADEHGIAMGFTDSIAIPVLMPHYDEFSTHARGLIPSSSADALWHWSRSNGGTDLSFHKYALTSRGGSRDEIALSSIVPGYLRQVRMLPLPMLLFLVGMMGILLAGLYVLVRYVIRSVFMIEAVDLSVPRSPAQVIRSRNRAIIVLGASAAEKTECLGEGPTVPVDFATTPDAAMWRQQAQASSDATVVVDNLKIVTDDASFRSEGLKFLEDLVFLQHRKVVAFSEVDPGIIPLASRGSGPVQEGEGKDASGEMERWTILMNTFMRTRFTSGSQTLEFYRRLDEKLAGLADGPGKGQALDTLKRTVKEECGEDPNLQRIGLMVLEELADEQLDGRWSDEFLRVMLEYSRIYYHLAWKICSRDQKRVLIHLARYGYVNAKNRVYVEQLFRVGLLIRNPALQPMNQTFRTFVLDVRRPADTAMTDGETHGSVWRMLHIPLTILFLGVAALLLATQRDVMDSTTAFLTAGAGLLPALLKLLGLFKPNESLPAGDD
jgi:hypothetical protein